MEGAEAGFPPSHLLGAVHGLPKGRKEACEEEGRTGQGALSRHLSEGQDSRGRFLASAVRFSAFARRNVTVCNGLSVTPEALGQFDALQLLDLLT